MEEENLNSLGRVMGLAIEEVIWGKLHLASKDIVIQVYATNSSRPVSPHLLNDRGEQLSSETFRACILFV